MHRTKIIHLEKWVGKRPVQQNLPQLDQLMGPPPCEGKDSLHLHAEISASPKILTNWSLVSHPWHN